MVLGRVVAVWEVLAALQGLLTPWWTTARLRCEVLGNAGAHLRCFQGLIPASRRGRPSRRSRRRRQAMRRWHHRLRCLAPAHRRARRVSLTRCQRCTFTLQTFCERASCSQYTKIAYVARNDCPSSLARTDSLRVSFGAQCCYTDTGHDGP